MFRWFELTYEVYLLKSLELNGEEIEGYMDFFEEDYAVFFTQAEMA